MKEIELSDLDRRLLERLATDARVSNREIAREFGLTEGAIRLRLKRLIDEKAIQVAAVTNIDHVPDSVIAYLWIDVDATYPLAGVLDALVAQPEITYVASLVGRADILAITWVRSATHLAEYRHNTIDPIPGIGRIRYELTHRMIKHDYRLTTITR